MPFQPVLLITDVLFFALTAIVIAFIYIAKSRPHLRRPWSKVITRKTGAVSIVILLTYYSIALLDSIHFHPKLEQATESQYQYSSEILSVLDIIMTPMRTQVEKTFSAPLATHLFSKEMVQYDDGHVEHIYPRLKYGGSYLDDPKNDRRADLLMLTLKSVLLSGLIWIGIWLIMILLLAWKWEVRYGQAVQRVLAGSTRIPVKAIALTTAVVILLGCTAMVIGSSYHVFGTDKVGQDVFYQTIKSIRTGILIGALTTLVMLPVAVTLGALAGFFKGWVDDVIQYIYTTLNSIPHVLLIAAAVLLLQVYMSNNAADFDSLTERADLRLLFLCLILGITSWTGLCRLLRAETFKLREMEYIQAAKAFGVPRLKILSRHIMPNFMHIVLISVVLDFSGLVLAEAVLSYINIGVDPAMNSWGNMINQARLEMARDPVVWWSLSAAFIFMFTLVLFANLFADVVRDALDPRISGSD